MKEVTLYNYQFLALRTEAPLEPIANRLGYADDNIDENTGVPDALGASAKSNIRLIHAALGISSDVHEYVNAADPVNEIEELSDLAWFVNVAAVALGVTFTHLVVAARATGAAGAEGSLVDTAAVFADAVKRQVYYGKDQRDVLLRTLAKLVVLIECAARTRGKTLEQVLAVNIAKLAARYPDKYSDAAANNRDLDAERAVLEATT